MNYELLNSESVEVVQDLKGSIPTFVSNRYWAQFDSNGPILTDKIPDNRPFNMRPIPLGLTIDVLHDEKRSNS